MYFSTFNTNKDFKHDIFNDIYLSISGQHFVGIWHYSYTVAKKKDKNDVDGNFCQSNFAFS